MNALLFSLVFVSIGLLLIVVKLFEENHFYSASLLISSCGASGLFLALGMYVKKQNES